MSIDSVPTFKGLLILLFSIGDRRLSIIKILKILSQLYFLLLILLLPINYNLTEHGIVIPERFPIRQSSQSLGGCVSRGGYLGSLFELSDVHVIGHVTARGPSCRYPLGPYLINQTPGEKLRHGVALRASVTLVKSCELLSQLDYFTLILWIPVNSWTNQIILRGISP